jgi:hypothetical protein
MRFAVCGNDLQSADETNVARETPPKIAHFQGYAINRRLIGEPGINGEPSSLVNFEVVPQILPLSITDSSVENSRANPYSLEDFKPWKSPYRSNSPCLKSKHVAPKMF